MKWPVKLLGSVCVKIGSGVTPRGGDSVYLDEGITLIRSQNVYNNSFEIQGLTHISDEQADRMQGVEVNSGDILLNITGDSVARVCQVPDAVLPARVNQHVSIIRTKYEKLSPRFLLYYLVSPYMQSTMLSLAGSGGTRKALTKAMIEVFNVPVPPLFIQESIADILSTYDDLIENNRRRIQLLEESARMLYKEWFVRLRFPGHEHVKIVDGVPEGWSHTYVPDIIEVNPTTKVEKNMEIFYIPMSSLSESGMTVNRSQFERRNIHTSVRFKNGDVLLARITPCLENGKTAFVYFLTENEVACGSTEFIVLRGKRVSPYFTYCLSRSYDFRENAIKSMIGSSGRQRVQTTCFNEFMIPLPSPSLLNQFDDVVRNCFEQIRVLAEKNEKLHAARDLLLSRLMNGEIPV